MKIKLLKIAAGFAVLLAALYGLHAFSLNSEMNERLSDEVWQNAIKEANEGLSGGGHEKVGLANVEQIIERGEAELESRLSSGGTAIRPGHRKKIQWVESEKPSGKRPWSIVYLHGFSAGPLELEPTISKLAEKLKANLFLTRLTAHGLTDGESFATVNAKDWVKDVAEAVAIGGILGENILLIGTSTGAALALRYMAVEDPSKAGNKVRAMILLSPNYQVSAFGAEVLGNQLGPLLAQVLIGKYRDFPAENELHGLRWTTKYRSEALHELILVTHSARTVALEKLKVPVLTVYTKKDEVVSVAEIEKRAADFQDPRSITIDWQEGQRHLLASETFHSENVDSLVNLISDWVSKLKVGPRENQNESSD